MKSIYLIGFMGSGKTTVGKALSKHLALPVFDTDEEIVRLSGKTITEIFDSEGESHFRRFETDCLKTLPILDSIITTGGGIVLRKENREWLKQNGLVVFLHATAKEIVNRLEGDQSRPLLSTDKRTRAEQILTERLPLYLDTANLTIETTGKSIDSIVKELVERLKSE